MAAALALRDAELPLSWQPANATGGFPNSLEAVLR